MKSKHIFCVWLTQAHRLVLLVTALGGKVSTISFFLSSHSILRTLIERQSHWLELIEFMSAEKTWSVRERNKFNRKHHLLKNK